MKPSVHVPLPFACLPSTYDALRSELPGQEQAFASMMIQPRADSFDDYCERCADEKAGLVLDHATGIAIQPVVGTMWDGVDPYYEAFYNYFNTSRIVEAAAEAAENMRIRALVFAFDSPGGYSRGVDDAHGAILQLRAARPDLPVVAYVNGYCCSAAAWVAAGCETRHSARRGTVGSVGTYVVTVDTSRYYAAMGVDIRLVTDGVYKGMGEPGVAWPAEWHEWVAKSVDGVSRRIKGAVSAACPKVTPEWMQGQAFGAADLLDAGEVGEGWFLQSVPALTGGGGFASLAEFLAALKDQL